MILSIQGKKIVLASQSRINPRDRDKRYFYYDVRPSDEGWEPASLKLSVMVNYMGTIALEEALKLDTYGGYELTNEDGDAILSIFYWGDVYYADYTNSSC